MTLLERTPRLLPDLFTGFFDDDRFLNFDFRTGWPAKVPAANVYEDEKAFLIYLSVPGMKKNDFHINIEDRNLWIATDRKVEERKETEMYSRVEFNYNSFKRSFTIPENVDPVKIVAKYENGLLMIELPKKVIEKRLPKKEIKII